MKLINIPDLRKVECKKCRARISLDLRYMSVNDRSEWFCSGCNHRYKVIMTEEKGLGRIDIFQITRHKIYISNVFILDGDDWRRQL